MKNSKSVRYAQYSTVYLYVIFTFTSKNNFYQSLYRCVVLSDPLKDSSRSQESWNAFLTKLRTLLLMSFTKNLGKFEDDMRTLREKRTEPGWSFCEYFMVQVRVPFYWRKYWSPSFNNGIVIVVVGFLVLFCSFFEGWGRKYEDWYKSSIFRSCLQPVCVTLQYSAIIEVESFQKESFMNLIWSKQIASRKCFSCCRILGKCPITVHVQRHSNL